MQLQRTSPSLPLKFRCFSPIKKCTQTLAGREGCFVNSNKVQINLLEFHPRLNRRRSQVHIHTHRMKTIKMADAFGKLAGICAGLEGRYSPAHPNLLPSSLVAQLTGAQAAAQSVTTAERTMRLAVANRAHAYRELTSTATRIRQSLLGDPNLAATLADVDLPLKKLSGNAYRAKAKAVSPPDGSPDNTARSYAKGLDYLSRMAHFEQVVSALQRNPAYAASAADLTVAALSARLDLLKTIQQAYTDAETELDARRAAVRKAFHAPYTGLAATGNAVIRSIRAQFGWRSPEAGLIRGIRFS